MVMAPTCAELEVSEQGCDVEPTQGRLSLALCTHGYSKAFCLVCRRGEFGSAFAQRPPDTEADETRKDDLVVKAVEVCDRPAGFRAVQIPPLTDCFSPTKAPTSSLANEVATTLSDHEQRLRRCLADWCEAQERLVDKALAQLRLEAPFQCRSSPDGISGCPSVSTEAAPTSLISLGPPEGASGGSTQASASARLATIPSPSLSTEMCDARRVSICTDFGEGGHDAMESYSATDTPTPGRGHSKDSSLNPGEESPGDMTMTASTCPEGRAKRRTQLRRSLSSANANNTPTSKRSTLLETLYLSSEKMDMEQTQSQELARGWVARNCPDWETLQEYFRTEPDDYGTCIEKFVRHRFFELFTLSVIVLNSIFIAYSSDLAMDSVEVAATEGEEESQFVGMEAAFCLFYTGEFFLKLVAFGKRFFMCRDWKWNWFDLTLVITSNYDFIMSTFIAADSMNMAFMRLLRLTKMMKMFRLVRVMKAFRELRLITRSLVQSASSMFWSLVLLFFVMFIFGNLFLQGTVTFLKDADASMVADRDQEEIHRWFGGLYSCMITLFLSSTGGVSYGEPARFIRVMGEHYYLMFLVYMAFYLFVVTNIVTGLLVEATMNNAEEDSQKLISEELARKNAYLNTIKAIFKRMDEDQNDTIGLFGGAGSRDLRPPDLLQSHFSRWRRGSGFRRLRCRLPEAQGICAKYGPHQSAAGAPAYAEQGGGPAGTLPDRLQRHSHDRAWERSAAGRPMK
eukprot:TRINITY_DN3811_c0_g1_i2.p1 TRINITY_DN3811_c0_g1~~TRINITY_DN3811_c0_g1_i2.p1  ORF type:complete len:739 (+),score=151.03 TRINITY_DN3811_c0_g1_i2:41-2257(+)